jgi:hypothetical protein
LAAELSEMDGKPWRFDGVDKTTPCLQPEGGSSDLDHERFLDALVGALRDGEATWNPYDEEAA